MANKKLLRKSTDIRRETIYFEDDELAAGAIVINENAYNVAFDREYDVRDIDNVYSEINETAGANGITYKIQSATKSFSKLSELVDADFADGFVAEAAVAANGSDKNVTAKTLQVTALRLRVRRTTAGMDGTLQGIIRTK